MSVKTVRGHTHTNTKPTQHVLLAHTEAELREKRRRIHLSFNRCYEYQCDPRSFLDASLRRACHLCFSACYSQGEPTDFPLRCISLSPSHYLLRLIRATVSAAAWSAKLCLIGWSLDIPIPIIHCK